MELGLQAEQIKNQNRFFVKELRKESTDLKNRIVSIHQDSLFVRSAQSRYPDLPLIPNLRCGGWYCPPALSKETAYFKSTDGHTRQWRFSLKRSNLHIIDLIKNQGGAILVDSTRRGKSMPDALSKTVPIWCSVLNQASHLKYGSPSTSQLPVLDSTTSRESSQSTGRGGTWLRTPKDVVGESEHEQIAEKVDGWVEEFLASDLPIPHLKLPLVPIFITPTSLGTSTSSLKSEPRSFHPLILLSTSHAIASGQTQSNTLFPNSRTTPFTYVQGAGDDHESWSQGLTPAMFWNPKNHEVLLECGRDEIESKVKQIVEDDRASRKGISKWFVPSGKSDQFDGDEEKSGDNEGSLQDERVGQTTIYLGQRNLNHQFDEVETSRYSIIIDCSSKPVVESVTQVEDHEETESEPEKIKNSHMQRTKIMKLGIEDGKRGVNQFAQSLPKVIEKMESYYQISDESSRVEVEDGPESQNSVLICSSDGKDLPGSFAIAILSIFFDDNQTLSVSKKAESNSDLSAHKKNLTKASVQKRLEWIVTTNPSSIPSRTHLKRINEWLLSPKGGRFG